MTDKYIATIKYCNLCGSEYTTQNNFVLTCEQNHVFYINPKICVGGFFLNKANKLLLVQRAVDPKKGLWDVPGGFVEVDENLEEAMQRELQEELGVTADNLKYFSSHTDIYTYHKVPYPTLCVFYTGIISRKKLDAQDDIMSYQFFELNDLPENQIAFKSISKSLKDFVQSRIGK